MDGVGRVIAAFDAFDRDLRDEARRRIAGMVSRTYARARAACPYGREPGPFTTHLRDQIGQQMHQTEASGAVFVERRGLGGYFGTDNVALWLEYGTHGRHELPARPWFGPASEPERAGFIRHMDDAVDAAKRRADL